MARFLHIYSFLFVFAICLIPETARSSDRLAIVVGHNVGEPDEVVLRYAEQDAAMVWDVLTSIGGIEKQDALLLLAPDSSEIEVALAKIARKVQQHNSQNRSVTVIFYYTGHGDKDSLHLGRDSYSYKQLEKRLTNLRADVTLSIIDACQTSPENAAMGIRAGPSFEVDVSRAREPKGVVTIHSTQKGDPAYESEKLKGAIFTHHLLSALRGVADTNQDGNVTLLEAYGFAYQYTVASSAKSSMNVQYPSYDIDLQGAEELVLTTPANAGAVLVLRGGEGGTYMVFKSPQGNLLAEIAASGKEPIRLAVPRGRLLVLRRDGGRTYGVEVDIPFGGHREIASYEFKEIPYDTMARKGGGLRLHPNRMFVGYLFQADKYPSAMITRHGFELGYAREFGSFVMGLDFGVTFAGYRGAVYDTRETALKLHLVGGGRVDLGTTALFFGIGPLLAFVSQHNLRLDAERLELFDLDIDLETRNFALGAGGGVEILWIVPIHNRFGVYLKAVGSLIAMPFEDQGGTDTMAVFRIAGDLGVEYRF